VPSDSTTIQKISEELKSALALLEVKEGISAKAVVDSDAGIMRIYSEGSDPLKRASSALSEVLELSYTTAEHHPYWSILYHSTEISKIVLERWNESLESDQVSEILWRMQEIRMTVERLAESANSESK
jgi:hypothetical protein